MKGFTLLELLVGLIIFLIGVIGFSGMSIMMSRGNQQAKAIDEAATLVQSAIEDLSGVLWAELGTNTSLPATSGLSNADVRVEGPLNRLGQTIGGGSTGPYPYYRSVVICSASTATVAPGSTPTHCGSATGSTNRPPELACSNSPTTLTPRTKIMRVMVGYTDRSGTCHFKSTDSISYNWQGTGP